MFSGRKALAQHSFLSEASTIFFFFFLFFFDVASIDFISLFIALTSSTPSHLMTIDCLVLFFVLQTTCQKR